ncbi:unnamed protein product [Closterium sp. Naga37s-1]|nr:unnamed protein product [Closterium sp. Naga37s-1]
MAPLERSIVAHMRADVALALEGMRHSVDAGLRQSVEDIKNGIARTVEDTMREAIRAEARTLHQTTVATPVSPNLDDVEAARVVNGWLGGDGDSELVDRQAEGGGEGCRSGGHGARVKPARCEVNKGGEHSAERGVVGETKRKAAVARKERKEKVREQREAERVRVEQDQTTKRREEAAAKALKEREEGEGRRQEACRGGRTQLKEKRQAEREDALARVAENRRRLEQEAEEERLELERRQRLRDVEKNAIEAERQKLAREVEEEMLHERLQHGIQNMELRADRTVEGVGRVMTEGREVTSRGNEENFVEGSAGERCSRSRRRRRRVDGAKNEKSSKRKRSLAGRGAPHSMECAVVLSDKTVPVEEAAFDVEEAGELLGLIVEGDLSNNKIPVTERETRGVKLGVYDSLKDKVPDKLGKRWGVEQPFRASGFGKQGRNPGYKWTLEQTVGGRKRNLVSSSSTKSRTSISPRGSVSK